MSRSSILILICCALGVLQSCSSSKYITPVSIVRPDSLRKITDDDIRKAFENRPQLVRPLIAAVYSAGSPVKGFADSLRKLADIQNVFEISPGLIEGDNYYARRNDQWYSYYDRPPSTNLQQLRLFAAQGKADILIYSGVFHFYHQEINALGYTYALLIPALFMPGTDAELRTEVDMFFIDVRNGFLYGTFHDERVLKKTFVTLYYQNSIDDTKDDEASKSIPKMIDYTKEILSNKDFFISKQ